MMKAVEVKKKRPLKERLAEKETKRKEQLQARQADVGRARRPSDDIMSYFAILGYRNDLAKACSIYTVCVLHLLPDQRIAAAIIF